MTKQQALKKLRETKQLSTAMLKPLGIGFETFLRLGQLPDHKYNEMIDRYLETQK
jgi:hypothetical protein